MITARLGDICVIKSGGTPSRSRPEYYGGSTPWAKIADIERSDGQLYQTEESITDEGLAAIGGRLFPVGTLLFAIYGSIGKMAFCACPLATNQAILGIDFVQGGQIEPRYLYRFLEALRPKLEGDGVGVTQKNLSAAYVRDIVVPLLPLPEQRRIAAILDQADALRRLRRQSLSRLSDLGQAIFFEMFGSADPTSPGSISCSLGDIIHPDDNLNYGVVQPGHAMEDGVPLVRAGDLLQPNLNISGLKRISPLIEKSYKRSRLSGSEILIGCVGSIGAIALATLDLKGANIARAVARVPLDPKLCDRVFIAEQLKTPHIQRYFSRETRTVSQPTLNIKQIKEAPIFLPPLEVQRSFSARLHALAPSTDAIDASLTQLDTLFASLQHRAFRGEL